MTLSCKCGATVERQRNRSSVACDKCQQKRVAATKQKWVETNRSAKNKQSREYYARCKAAALAYYSNGSMRCACRSCPETMQEFLTIDHVNNDGAEHRKKNPAAISLAPWLVSHGFPEGYQVLCFNCNIAKGINGRCPHEQVA
jgi:hypothetical protein